MNKIKGYLSLLLLLKLFFIDGLVATLFFIEVAPIFGIVYFIATIFMFIVCYKTITSISKLVRENSDVLMKTAFELGLIKQKKEEVDIID